ncbi:hypothetical protein [Dyadobacter sp. CY312]|uniref:DUF7659 family protein n=1 Tax=Dyadobacter sp. CY312 TaxID=2907303 RepID=UPI001F22B0F3|nr:hypothetical protein [Dyadobacter sp. CY312]MCE7039189.1 hypothetical protein [Dyadobacter sp. CY312]
MSAISVINEHKEQKVSALIAECGVFFAFSKKQFEENKTPLQDGEKYREVLGGGFVPSSKYERLRTGLDEIENWYNTTIKDGGLLDAQILYELCNHECFYTGEWHSLANDFGFKVEDVRRVFYGNHEQYA